MIRLLLADDHRMFRQGVVRLLADEPELVVAAEAASCPDALEALRHSKIDVIVLDISLPGRGGIDLAIQARKMDPAPRILIVSMHCDEPYVTQAIRAGVDGYLTKESAADELVLAIRRVARGDRYICLAVAEKLAIGISRHNGSGPPHDSLSEREYKIFEMLVAGNRGCEIAQQLSLSEKTVSTHKSNVLKKLNASNRTELLLYAIKHQLVAV